MKKFKNIRLLCAIPVFLLLSLPSIAQAIGDTVTSMREYDISLMEVGDNLMHMGIVYSGKNSDGTYDYSMLYDGISDFLDSADLKVINQETPLAGNERGFSGFPKFNSPTEVGDAIAKAGFNVVLTATNHAADQGISGLESYASFWESSYPDILMTGISKEADTSRIGLTTIEDVTFAILNYTYGPNMETLPSSLRGHLNMLCDYNETTGKIDFTTLNPQVIEDIEEARTLADVVIVFPHWGTEYQESPSSYQKEFAKEMTEAGADLIIGTHPHVPQPVEWVTADNGNTSLCYYSLGNYVSTQQNELSMLEEMAWVTFHVTKGVNTVSVEISPENTGVVPLVCQYTSSPVRFENVYLLEDYTEELAKKHGIHSYGNVNLTLSDLEGYAQRIFGDFILKKSDVLGTSDLN
jgi:poly-gamma-glutamate synthesis protein (capsule biosynthesis protein)